MIPIFEQGKGQGIGHTVDSFYRRFEEICREHLKAGKAKAFAFIFYDFLDRDLKTLLKDQGVFSQLDRLAGHKLSIFFLHTASRSTVEAFNQEFLAALGIPETVGLPTVVFFKLREDDLTDVAVVELNSSDLIHGFKELYDIIGKYIADEVTPMQQESRAIRWFKSGAKFITTEAFHALLEKLSHIAGWV
jgi:hypothetical protein